MKRFYSVALMAALTASSVSAYDFSSYNSPYSGSDYREALNMGLKFFGGQRCGKTNNWMLKNNPDVLKKFCHVKDGQGKENDGANGSYDLTGGWHDCGDHIKVATTMGYAAISLLVAYDLWPQAFQDNYDGAYGSPNKIPDVLDEVKIATDYFMKCFIGNKFVYYVGCPGDHNRWVTSSNQSNLSPELGGDPRPFSSSTTIGGPQAANYATALALMAKHYPDADYKQKCADAAVVAYNYAKNNKSQQAPIPEFYSNPNSEWTDELSLAAITMYNLTGDESYKTEAFGYLQGKWESNSPLAWDTEADYAYYYLAVADAKANNGQGGTISDFLRKNVFKVHLANAITDPNGFPYYASRWGTNKLALGGATAAALYAKLVDDGVLASDDEIEKVKNFNQRVVDYILGNNEFNHPFLHGYKGDMTFRIHHRNAMGRNDNPPSSTKNKCEFMFASGGVIGGPSGTGRFDNIIEGGASFTETEGGCDYNAPFIVAIANIAAKKDPVQLMDVKNVESSKFNVYPTAFEDYIVVEPIEVDYDGEGYINLMSMSGQTVLSARTNGAVPVVLQTEGLPNGVYVVNVTFKGGNKSYKLIKK